MPAFGFGVKCMVCEREVEHLQLVSGIPIVGKNEKTGKPLQLYGHYQCVKGEIGAEKTLKAMELGFLPNIQDDLITNGRLKKFVESENIAKAARDKVYEFIGN